MKIIDNVFLIPDVAANTYLIASADGLTLIDAALPRNHGRILRYIASLGHRPQDLKRILITHSDWDHVGSLAALHRATGARTYASRIEAEALAAGRRSRPIKPPPTMSLGRRLLRLLCNPRPFRVDEILEPGQVLPILGGLQVIDSAGHCPGHISFYSSSAGVLFCGDSMITDEHGIHGSRPIYTWDAALAQAAVRAQAALQPHILCSGHGPVVMDAAGKFPI